MPIAYALSVAPDISSSEAVRAAQLPDFPGRNQQGTSSPRGQPPIVIDVPEDPVAEAAARFTAVSQVSGELLTNASSIPLRPRFVFGKYEEILRGLLEVHRSITSDYGLMSSLRRIQAEVGPRKLQAHDHAARALRRSHQSLRTLDSAVRDLLKGKRSGRLDDAIDLLGLMDAGRVSALVERSLQADPSMATDEDYWFVLIRAAGRKGAREIVERSLKSPTLALQEAAVQALGDIADPAAVETLKSIASDPGRPRIIRELARDLVSDLA